MCYNLVPLKYMHYNVVYIESFKKKLEYFKLCITFMLFFH